MDFHSGPVLASKIVDTPPAPQATRRLYRAKWYTPAIAMAAVNFIAYIGFGAFVVFLAGCHTAPAETARGIMMFHLLKIVLVGFLALWTYGCLTIYHRAYELSFEENCFVWKAVGGFWRRPVRVPLEGIAQVSISHPMCGIHRIFITTKQRREHSLRGMLSSEDWGHVYAWIVREWEKSARHYASSRP